MRHRDAALRNHDHQIAQAQLEARVPGDTQDDDLPVEVSSLEHSLDRVERFHSSSSPGDGTFAPEPCFAPFKDALIR